MMVGSKNIPILVYNSKNFIIFVFMKMTRGKSFSSIRKYNKYRKQFPLGHDDNGKQLYPWDWIMVSDPINNPPWCAQIQHNNLDGAYILAHPARIRNNDNKPFHCDLWPFIRKDSADYPEYNKTIVKITYEQYEKWLEQQRISESIKLYKPKEFELPETELNTNIVEVIF